MDEANPDSEEQATPTETPASEAPATQALHALDAMDLRALREADSINFSHNAKDRPDRPGRITATKKLAQPSPWEQERDHVIEVESSIESYDSWTDDRERDQDRPPFRYANESIYSTMNGLHGEAWRTIAALLRAGDVLALRWRADAATCELYKKKDLHGDDLHLVVRRGERTMTFLIATRVCEANSARMVRRYPWGP